MGILSLLAGAGAAQAPRTPSPAALRDSDGQAPVAAYRSEAIVDRQIDELIGIAKGLLADGHVNQIEATFLLRWLETNRAASALWPAKALYPRLVAILSDGVIDAAEEKELLELMLRCVGGNAPARDEASMSTALPLTKPPPPIAFAERSFCLTGKFYCGTRSWCEDQVAQRGGMVAPIRKDLNFLVIGEIGSRDWIHSTHGRKIEKAVEYNDRGCSIAIVSEEHWHEALR